MSGEGQADPSFESVDGPTGERATDAFALLGDETRLAILLALWEAYDPFAGQAYGGDNALSFSELYERVDYDHPGNFSYHLEKLTGRFVKRTEDGYKLRRAGRQIMYAVLAGTATASPAFSDVELDVPCRRCGAPTALTYEEGNLYHRCTACMGRASAMREDLPDGTLNVHGFPPAGLERRAPETVLRADRVRAYHHRAMMIEGVCPECAGSVTGSVAVCDAHEGAGVCSACGYRAPVRCQYVCQVCKRAWQTSPAVRVASHPAVIGFLYEHGIEFRFTTPEGRARVTGWDQELLSEDPVRIRVTVPADGDTLRLTLDGELQVTDVTAERE